MALTQAIIDLFIPILVISVISLMLFSILESKTGLTSGLIISIGLCVYAEILPFWVITLLIIYLGITLYQELDTINKGHNKM